MARILNRRPCRQPPAVILLVMLFLCLALYQMMSANARGKPKVQEEVKIHTPKLNDLDPTIIPAEYNATAMFPFCDERFGHSYLSNFLNAATLYCTDESSSQMACFNNKVDDNRIDSFCIGGPASYHPEWNRFSLDCVLREIGEDEQKLDVVPVLFMSDYPFNTGTKWALQNAVHFTDADGVIDPVPQEPRRGAPIALLVKREDKTDDLWHSLMEIMSMYFSIDILRMSHNLETGRNYFLPEDVENTQVVLLDDLPDGPYFRLLSLLAKKPIIRHSDSAAWAKNMPFRQLITALPGASNPFYQADDHLFVCDNSTLLHAFVNRVLHAYNIPVVPTAKQEAEAASSAAKSKGLESNNKINITYVQRKTRRRLISSEALLSRLSFKYPSTLLGIKTVVLEDLPFDEQLALIHEQTDILIGVHGNGLTHTMFLRPGSALVEILPFNAVEEPASDALQEGSLLARRKKEDARYQNLAKLADSVSYHQILTKDDKKKTKAKDNWETDDVYVEEGAFVDFMLPIIDDFAKAKGLSVDGVTKGDDEGH